MGDAYWDLWAWAVEEFCTGSRIKASKLMRISEKMKLLSREAYRKSLIKQSR